MPSFSNCITVSKLLVAMGDDVISSGAHIGQPLLLCSRCLGGCHRKQSEPLGGGAVSGEQTKELTPNGPPIEHVTAAVWQNGNTNQQRALAQDAENSSK